MKYEGFNDILEVIEKIFVNGTYYYSDYVVPQLRKPKSLELIRAIMNQSGKTASEAVIVFLAAIRYIQNDIYALYKLKESDSFETFLKDNYNRILNVSATKKVQGNALERGLPILEVLASKISHEQICLIELGASYGLIGNCLLDSKKILDKKDVYFRPGQKIFSKSKDINCYLGIDIDPPQKEWLLACITDPEDAIRIEKSINDNENQENFKLIKGSAIGFSDLPEVREIIKTNYKFIILTSFMMYQLTKEQQSSLQAEIKEFSKKHNGHWVRQEVDLKNGNAPEYFIDWDGERIVDLKDDRCSDWRFIN